MADFDEVAHARSAEADLAERAAASTDRRVRHLAARPSVQALADDAVARFGAAHVLCNNAGVAGKGDPWTGPMSAWDWVVGINLYGVVHGIRAFLPIMQDQGEGHIVNTASMAGLRRRARCGARTTSPRPRCVALSEGLFLELKGTARPSSVSVLCPGFVKTNLVAASTWQDRLGDAAGPHRADPDRADDRDHAAPRASRTAIDPADVAAQVVDAMQADRFWILTHPEVRQAPVERMQRAARRRTLPCCEPAKEPPGPSADVGA